MTTHRESLEYEELELQEDQGEDDDFYFDEDEDDLLERSQRKLLEAKRTAPRRMRDY